MFESDNYIQEGLGKGKIKNSNLTRDIANSINYDIDNNPMLSKTPDFVVHLLHLRSRVAQRRHTKAIEYGIGNAKKDSLTGLIDRETFVDELKSAMLRVKRTGGEIRVIVVDINRFKKEINDTFGHAIGDKVIKAYVAALRSGAREYDLIGRIGKGDEFGIILEDREITDGALADSYVTRVDQKLVEISKTDDDLMKVARSINGFSASMGMSTYLGLGDTDVTAEKLLSIADIAMYHAKTESPSTSKLVLGNPEMVMPKDIPR